MKYYIDRFLKHIHDLPEQKKMLVSIDYTSDMVRKHFELILDKYLITPPQYNLLVILKGTHPKPCSIRQLKDMIIDRNSDVSRMVERLHSGGLIERERKTGDRRSMDVVINKRGLTLLAEIEKKESEAMYNPFYQISEGEARQLNELLQKVLDGLRLIPMPE
jgi:MarR family transcriptional regulator, multiple gene regulator MgrA